MEQVPLSNSLISDLNVYTHVQKLFSYKDGTGPTTPQNKIIKYKIGTGRSKMGPVFRIGVHVRFVEVQVSGGVGGPQ